jgi:RNA polymerase subunit RPABC4/transcription elongation factor Spt4
VEPHCVNCDYNLTGNESGMCPECGTPIPEDNKEPEPTIDPPKE